MLCLFNQSFLFPGFLDCLNIIQLFHRERLTVALHRLELRATLYTQPDRPEDQAAMIIEQVDTSIIN